MTIRVTAAAMTRATPKSRHGARARRSSIGSRRGCADSSAGNHVDIDVAAVAHEPAQRIAFPK